MKHSLSKTNIPEEEDNDTENNNYFYNDEVNYTYKPSIIIKKEKKEKIKSHKNKFLSCEIINNSASKIKKIRDNYNPLEGNIFKSQAELDFISRRIHGNKYKIFFNLLYKATEDKDKSLIFHRKCDHAQTTLILIETKKGLRFGGYTKRTWREAATQKMDNDAFIFSLDKKQIFNVIKGKNAIGCFNDLGPVFLGGFKIYDNFFNDGGCSFTRGINYNLNRDYELTNGEESFKVNEIEAYEIKIA